ncbi:MAG: outer membrane protein assembly factor BamC [Gammaproteobacteria bacterium]|nr:outer membrane protein assembly factor BamC [Gammaproteobacteria bacterium]
MKKIIGLALIASSVLLLTGCGGTFRNRAFDYTRTDVKQVPPLKIPAGVTSPDFQPALSLPAGVDSYPPSPMPVMTPPNYNDTFQIDAKAKQASPISNGSAKTVSISKPNTTAQSLTAPAKTSMKLSAQIVRTDANVPVLEINAPFDISWNQMALAIKKSGFRIVNSEKPKGYYFIALEGDNNDADAVLLYLKQNQAMTQVILYTSAGNPDSSANANLTLKQFSRNL